MNLVGKTDDNVVLDMGPLIKEVRNLNTKTVRTIFCGSGTPHKNMKPLRSDRTHMTGEILICKTRKTNQHFIQEIGVYLRNN